MSVDVYKYFLSITFSVMLFAIRTLCEDDQHCCHWTYRGSTKDGRPKTCWLKREKGVVVKKEEHRENKVFSGSINCPGSSYEPKNCPEPTTDTPAPTPDGGTTTAGEDTTTLGEDTTTVGEDTTTAGEDTTTAGEDTTTG